MRKALSNTLIAAAVLLALVPFGMRTYANWWERKERQRLFGDLPVQFLVPEARPPVPHAVTAAERAKLIHPASNKKPATRRPARPTGAAPSPALAAPTAVRAPIRTTRKAAGSAAGRKAGRRATGKAKPNPAPQRQGWGPSLIQIPAIGVDAVVVKGSGNWRMIKGPAYEPWSAAPGEKGNAVIAAHRNMWASTFAHLPRVKPGDAVYITTRTHQYKYVVQWARVVSTGSDAVLSDTPRPAVTLYTCVHPFRKDRRFVVRGTLAATRPLPQSATARKPGERNG